MANHRFRELTITLFCGLIVGAGITWFIQLAWRSATEYSENPRRATFKNQLMRRKSDAMDDALQAIVRGRLSQVRDAAERMEECANAIDGYLSTEVYTMHGEEFYQAIEELRVSAGNKDRQGAKEAILRLERSCIDCHYLITVPE